MSFSPVSYLPNVEDGFKLVPLSEVSSITREDNKIVLTTQNALNYLQKALKNQQIYQNYGKYFAYSEYQAKVEDFEKSGYPDPEEIRDFKTTLVTEICSRLSEGVQENFKTNTLHKIIELSLKGLALDKKTGTLFLITKNQRNKKYSFTAINATNLENPSQEDWKRLDANLLLTDGESDGYFSSNLVCNGNKFSIAFNASSQPFNRSYIPPLSVFFIWENIKEEIQPLYMEKGLVQGENLDRNYLQIKTRDKELYFKSHTNEIPPLITDELLEERGLFQFFEAETPSNGCCFIQKNSIKKLFANQPQIKPARNFIQNY